MDTYVYAPKDDEKHRTAWREPYTETELEGIRALVTATRDLGIAFVYAIAPGCDMRIPEPVCFLCFLWFWGGF